MVVALLVWYDERPELLSETVASWAKLADALVALDGAFVGYPDGRAVSPPEQADAIKEAAAGAEMPHVIIKPFELWSGHPAKRTEAIRMAEEFFGTTKKDWLLVIDADEELAHVGDARAILDETELDVATVTAEIDDHMPVEQRRLLRAIPGLEVQGLHYRYACPDGRFLWNYPGQPEVEAVETLVRFRHRRDERPEARLKAAKAFYQQRHEE